MKLRYIALATLLEPPLATMGAQVSGVPAVGDAGRSSTDRTPLAHIFVSPSEIRVVFTHDSARRWASGAPKSRTSAPPYFWSMSVEGVDGPRLLLLQGSDDANAGRHFASLEGVVSVAVRGFCKAEAILVCDPSHTSASIQRGAVVLMLRDSAAIMRTFGLLPRRVVVSRRQPFCAERDRRDSVDVEYVAPRLPEADSAFRAPGRITRRGFGTRTERVTQFITSGHDGGSRTIWVAEGDSATIGVSVSRCRYDTCRIGRRTLSDSAWKVADTTVARVLPRNGVDQSPPSFYLKGVRAGRTVVRVDEPKRNDVDSTLQPPAELPVLVTPPIERLQIWPRPDTMRVGDLVAFRVRGIGRSGRVVEQRLPTVLVFMTEETGTAQDTFIPVTFGFASIGSATISTQLGSYVDTIRVVVIGTPRR